MSETETHLYSVETLINGKRELIRDNLNLPFCSSDGVLMQSYFENYLSLDKSVKSYRIIDLSRIPGFDTTRVHDLTKVLLSQDIF